MTEDLKYLKFLNTNLKNNHNYDNKQILLYNFSLFKNDLSGYINVDTISKFYIDLHPFAIYTNIDFKITTVFTSNYFYVTTDLITSEYNQSPNITIYTNVKYKFTNTNLLLKLDIENSLLFASSKRLTKPGLSDGIN